MNWRTKKKDGNTHLHLADNNGVLSYRGTGTSVSISCNYFPSMSDWNSSVPCSPSWRRGGQPSWRRHGRWGAPFVWPYIRALFRDLRGGKRLVQRARCAQPVSSSGGLCAAHCLFNAPCNVSRWGAARRKLDWCVYVPLKCIEKTDRGSVTACYVTFKIPRVVNTERRE